MTKAEEVDLIKKILNGEKNLFNQILETYQRPILVYSLRLLNFHQQDAEDNTAQTFTKAYINLAGFNPRLKFSSWLYRIAHNEAVNRIRQNSKHFAIDISQKEVPINLDFEKPNKIDLEKILVQLSNEDRNLLTLFYLQELQIQEISEILKISEGAVKTRLNRARNRAKKFCKN